MTKTEKELIQGIEALRVLLKGQELHLTTLRQHLYQGKYVRMRTDTQEFVGYVVICAEITLGICVGQSVEANRTTYFNWNSVREIKAIDFPPDEVSDVRA